MMASANYAFNILDSVDSTNNYAMAQLHAGLAKHGDAFFAWQQTNGKGQRGKSWQTGNGQNIALSIVIEPKPLLVAEQFRLSAVVALACHQFFAGWAGEDTRIKWPNDIYWRDRKAGGILIENSIGLPTDASQDKIAWKFAVVGIGMNINQTDLAAIPGQAVSLKQITGRTFDPIELARQLQQKVLDHWEALHEDSWPGLLQRYNQVLYKAGECVQLRRQQVVFETTVKSVLPDGRLFTTDLVDNYFSFGEVEWLFAPANTNG